jgi:uncharacterized protein (TIGR02246 family)
MRGLWCRAAAAGWMVLVMFSAANADAALASAATAARPSLESADDAALRALMAQMTDAWNRGDSAALAATFAEDGEMVAGDGTLTSGRAKIERYLADLMTRLPKGTRFTAAVTGVRLVTPDVAVLSSSGGFLMPGDVDVTPERAGFQAVIAVREGGAWRATLFQRTRVLPPRPATTPAR